MEESTKKDRAKCLSHGLSRDLIKQCVQGAEPTGCMHAQNLSDRDGHEMVILIFYATGPRNHGRAFT